MTAPRIRATSSSRTPAAATLAQQAAELSSNLRAAQRRGDGADALARRGRAMLEQLDPQDPASAELRTLLDNVDRGRGVARSVETVERVRTRPVAGFNASRALAQARRDHGSSAPVLRALGAGGRSLRPLTRVSAEELTLELKAAGASGAEASALVDRLETTAVQRFGLRIRGRLGDQLRSTARRLERLASGEGLDRAAHQMLNVEGQSLLGAMRGAGVDVEGLQHALERSDGDQVRAELRVALRDFAAATRELSGEVRQMNVLSGELFIHLPGAARQLVEDAGMDGRVADGVGDGTLLGDAVARHVAEAREDRESAATWMSWALGLSTVVLGGLTAPIAIANEAMHAANAHESARDQAITAGASMGTLAEAEAAQEAADRRTEEAVINSAVSLGALGLGHVAGNGARTLARGRVGERAVEWISAGAERLLEVGSEVGAHTVLHDE